MEFTWQILPGPNLLVARHRVKSLEAMHTPLPRLQLRLQRDPGTDRFKENNKHKPHNATY